MMLKLVSTSFLRSANCSKVTTGRALSTTGLDYAISRGGALGERRLLVFVHGLFGNKLNFKSHAAKLSSQLGVDAVSVTLRNHRNSFRADSMTYVDMAVDLRNLIRDELKSESATVVGHSLGGKAVSLLALLSPEIVRGVIVVDIAPVIYPGSGNEHLKYAQAMRDADIAQAKSIGDVDQLLSDAVPDKTMRSFLLTNLRRGSNGEFEWAHNASIFAEPSVMDGLCGWPDDAVRGRQYAGPALFVRGGKSKYVRDKDFQGRVKEMFPNAQLVTVPDAGHWVHSDFPNTFDELVAKFVADT